MDIAEVIRMVLDALGLDLFYMPLPVWDASMSGSKRSLVRRVGSSLPLQPMKRAKFQLQLIDGMPNFSTELSASVCPNLSDVTWLQDDTGDKTIRGRAQCRATKQKHVLKPKDENVQSQTRPCTPVDQMIPKPLFQQTPDPAAMQKINALEDELDKLRQQIAMIVLLQEQTKNPAPPETVPGTSILPTPPTTPGPPVFRAPLPVPPAPPGCPPPPPPPPPMVAVPQMSVIDMIKMNKKSNAGKSADAPKKEMPDMADVLKGLGTVKLKSIARSPGGTPIRQKPREAGGSDPASLIAQALKKKFAFRHMHSPEDKENFGSNGFTPSPKKTPEFGQHKLKPIGKARRKSGISPLTVVN